MPRHRFSISALLMGTAVAAIISNAMRPFDPKITLGDFEDSSYLNVDKVTSCYDISIRNCGYFPVWYSTDTTQPKTRTIPNVRIANMEISYYDLNAEWTRLNSGETVTAQIDASKITFTNKHTGKTLRWVSFFQIGEGGRLLASKHSHDKNFRSPKRGITKQRTETADLRGFWDGESNPATRLS